MFGKSSDINTAKTGTRCTYGFFIQWLRLGMAVRHSIAHRSLKLSLVAL